MFLFSFIVLPFTIILLLIKLYLLIRKQVLKRRNNNKLSVGFFHPYCNAGGGGERVLWEAIRAVQKEYKDVHCVIYSGDKVSPEDIIKNVKLRFNIELLRQIEIIYLKRRFLVEAKYYPFCTLLMQSLGSVFLALEAIFKYIPDIYLDTMGYAWTFPVFKYLGSSRIGAYVHFPTISTDMLRVVQKRQVGVNNRQFISDNRVFSQLKLIYYKMFAYIYGLVGRRAEVVMVNSSWTRDHILSLWQKQSRTFVVYPPCDVSEFASIPLRAHDGKTKFLSIAQFRPEKDHRLQIEAFHQFLSGLDTDGRTPTLVLVGSCRDNEDQKRVHDLKTLCKVLGIEEKVEFKVNLSFKDIVREMEDSLVALHTMRDEHFGIGIVECMSAGLIMIAHDSGGPRMDIVVDFHGKKTGFLATDAHGFAVVMKNVWMMSDADLDAIRICARETVRRFSVDEFDKKFLQVFKLLV